MKTGTELQQLSIKVDMLIARIQSVGSSGFGNQRKIRKAIILMILEICHEEKSTGIWAAEQIIRASTKVVRIEK